MWESSHQLGRLWNVQLSHMVLRRSERVARPVSCREIRCPDIKRTQKGVFNLDDQVFPESAERGGAGGPSGMTVEHLQPLLDHPRDL